MRTKAKALAGACALVLAAAAPAYAQQHRQSAQGQPPDLRQWHVNHIYGNAWSARQMLGAQVRGANGKPIGVVTDIIVGPHKKAKDVVVSLGGFLGLGARSIAVKWKDVLIGPKMAWVKTPITRRANGAFVYDGKAAYQLGPINAPAGGWRVEQLLGDYASLRNVRDYGYVYDVIFNRGGKAQAVVVDRNAGNWGGRGYYAYPYTGWGWGGYYGRPYAGPRAQANAGRQASAGASRPGNGNVQGGYPSPLYYGLGYPSSAVGNYNRFSYVQLGRLSHYANGHGGNRKHVAIQPKNSNR